MKVKAYIIVSKGYPLAITASQWLEELLEHAEEHNREAYGASYLNKPKSRAVVAVEFDVPDSVFVREPVSEVSGEVVAPAASARTEE